MIEEKKIKKILKDLPQAPGVYKMINGEGKVIYVGKAKDLSKRVRQYFQKNYEHSTRTVKLLEKMVDLKWTVVDSELEAVILEHSLIKELQPKYNVIMKDDKNYVYIKITKNEDFPRIQITRKVQKDGAKYIGPKTAAHKVKETFKVIKRIFPFRHCGLNINVGAKNKNGEYDVEISNQVIKYPCLDYFIKRCAAPCIGKISKEDYREIIENVERFFEGKTENIVGTLKKEMIEAAKNKRFEKAAKIRDQIKQVEEILEKQKVSDPNQENKDIINYCIVHEKAYFNLFQIRDGKLIGQENFVLSAPEMDENSADPEVLEAFINQYYKLATDIPKEILVPHNLENHDELEKFMEKESGKRVKIIVPKIGEKSRLLEMSLNNARIFADRNKTNWQEESKDKGESLKELQKILGIKKTLKRIECYDISHLSGTDTVGSMIVFENGVPKNSMYRKFHMRTVLSKPDDYKSMEEVLTRRFNHISGAVKNLEYMLKKAGKKDKNFIEKYNEVDFEKTDRTFYMLRNGKKQIGFISIKEYTPKIAELSNLWVLKKERGKRLEHKLLEEAIKKMKSKRIYIICKEALKDYYLMAGFEELKKIPEELEKKFKQEKKEKGNVLCLVYDKAKHKMDESFSKIPDLVVIDGGKGQLQVAVKVLESFKIKIPVIALAKQFEEIFTPNQKKRILLSHHNEALKLLQRARDEAHRFAISYNKNLREKHFS